MKLTDLTFPQFIGLVAALFALFVALISAYNAVMTALKNHREAKKEHDTPFVQLQHTVEEHGDRLSEHEQMLKRDKARIDDMSTQSTMTLRGVRALLSHEINGNSNDKLEASMTEIDNYLISRK